MYRLKPIRERFGDLMINVDSFIKNFRHLPQDIRTTVIRHTVEQYLTGVPKKF